MAEWQGYDQENFLTIMKLKSTFKMLRNLRNISSERSISS